MKRLFSSPAPLARLAIVVSVGLLALPSQAGSCQGSDFNNSTCPTGWNTITSGGVTYTISPISFVTAPNPSDEFVFTDVGLTNVSFQYNINPTIASAFSNSFTYTINITTPGYTFHRTQSNATGSDLLGGSFSTTTSNPSNFFSPRTANTTTNPSPSTTIASGLTSLIVKQDFSNSGGGSTLSSVGANYSAVPGPIPVLGAGLAYGMTRKLRRRIRQAC
ncbi:MAG: hypothetical protein ACK6BG_04845 [Cyanobacteriota bacterium]|jgi:hypothetical protein